MQASVTGACAVMFDENCCKSSKTFHIVKKNEEGKLCGTIGTLNPFSSCQGPRLKDDIEVRLFLLFGAVCNRTMTGKNFISTI